MDVTDQMLSDARNNFILMKCMISGDVKWTYQYDQKLDQQRSESIVSTDTKLKDRVKASQ